MEETQPIDWIMPTVEPEATDDASPDVCGYLHVSPAGQTWPLYLGANLIGRQGRDPNQQDMRLGDLRQNYPDMAVHGIFLSEACLSREHAIIFLEKGQRQGTIMDKASSNKTFLIQNDGNAVILHPGTMMIITSGAHIRMGSLDLRFTMPHAFKSDALNMPVASGFVPSALIPRRFSQEVSLDTVHGSQNQATPRHAEELSRVPHDVHGQEIISPAFGNPSSATEDLQDLANKAGVPMEHLVQKVFEAAFLGQGLSGPAPEITHPAPCQPRVSGDGQCPPTGSLGTLPGGNASLNTEGNEETGPDAVPCSQDDPQPDEDLCASHPLSCFKARQLGGGVGVEDLPLSDPAPLSPKGSGPEQQDGSGTGIQPVEQGPLFDPGPDRPAEAGGRPMLETQALGGAEPMLFAGGFLATQPVEVYPPEADPLPNMVDLAPSGPSAPLGPEAGEESFEEVDRRPLMRILEEEEEEGANEAILGEEPLQGMAGLGDVSPDVTVLSGGGQDGGEAEVQQQQMCHEEQDPETAKQLVLDSSIPQPLLFSVANPIAEVSPTNRPLPVPELAPWPACALLAAPSILPGSQSGAPPLSSQPGSLPQPGSLHSSLAYSQVQAAMATAGRLASSLTSAGLGSMVPPVAVTFLGSPLQRLPRHATTGAFSDLTKMPAAGHSPSAALPHGFETQVAADALDEMARGSPETSPSQRGSGPGGSVERKKKLARKSTGGIMKTPLAAAAVSPGHVTAAATLAAARAASVEREAERSMAPSSHVPSGKPRRQPLKRSMETEGSKPQVSPAASTANQHSQRPLPAAVSGGVVSGSPSINVPHGARRQRRSSSAAVAPPALPTLKAEGANDHLDAELSAAVLEERVERGKPRQKGGDDHLTVTGPRARKRPSEPLTEAAGQGAIAGGPLTGGAFSDSAMCKRPRRGCVGQLSKESGAPPKHRKSDSKAENKGLIQPDPKPEPPPLPKAEHASNKRSTAIPEAADKGASVGVPPPVHSKGASTGRPPVRRHSSSEAQPAATATATRTTYRRLSAAVSIKPEVVADPALILPAGPHLRKPRNIDSAMLSHPAAVSPLVPAASVGRLSRSRMSLGNSLSSQDDDQGGSSGGGGTGNGHLPHLVLAMSSAVSDADKKNAEALVKKLPGARIAGKDELNFTHLLMMLGDFKQTLKVMLAMASGRPLVSPSWVDACRQAGTLLRVVQYHVAVDEGKEKELRFSAWRTYQKVLQEGRVLEARSKRPDGDIVAVSKRCILTPGLQKKEKQQQNTLPLIIEAAGGVLVDVSCSKSSYGDCLVFGVEEDVAWAKSNLPVGVAVFDKSTLTLGVVRGSLDLSCPLFRVS